jgi:hypothetical protein
MCMTCGYSQKGVARCACRVHAQEHTLDLIAAAAAQLLRFGVLLQHHHCHLLLHPLYPVAVSAMPPLPLEYRVTKIPAWQLNMETNLLNKAIEAQTATQNKYKPIVAIKHLGNTHNTLLLCTAVPTRAAVPLAFHPRHTCLTRKRKKAQQPI